MKQTAVVIFGRQENSDEGIGHFLADRLAKEDLPDLEIVQSQAFKEQWMVMKRQWRRILFAGPSQEGPVVLFNRLRRTSTLVSAVAPYVPLGFFEGWVREYENEPAGLPDIYLCQVRGDRFKEGKTLSRMASRRAKQAVKRVAAIFRTGI